MNSNNLILDKLNLLHSRQKELWPQIDDLQSIVVLDLDQYERLSKMQNEYIKLGYQIEILNEILQEIDSEK
mgnify:FL=1